MNQIKISFLENVVDLALAAGATGAEVMFGRASSLSILAFEQKIEKYQVSSSQVLGIRLCEEQKVGISYCESLDQASIHDMISQARSSAKWMEPDAHEKIDHTKTVTSVLSHTKHFHVDDSCIEEKMQRPLELEAAMLARGPEVKSAPINGLSEREGESYLVSSSGVRAYARARSFSLYTQALLTNGRDNMTHYKSSIGRTFGQLNLKECVDGAYNFAKDMLKARQISSGHYACIFTANALSEFMHAFSLGLSGKAAVEGRSPWKDKVGTNVAAPTLSLCDIPDYPISFSQSLFDAEGNLHRPNTLIENGVLKTFCHNSATASFFKVPNTALASRSSKGPLGVSTSNTVILAGLESDHNLFEHKVIVIHSMQGLHSGSDAISGNFSFGAKGYLHENGSVTPFKDVTIAGNFYNMLLEIDGIGDVTHANDSRDYFAPTIRWGKISVGGI